MKVYSILALLFASVCVQAQPESVEYDNHVVLRTNKLSAQQASALRQLENSSRYDFWKSPRTGGEADIMVPRSHLPLVQVFLEKHRILSDIIIDSVGRLARETMPKNLGQRKVKLDFEDYHSHDIINSYLDDLAEKYSWVNSVSIGKSFEGRVMRVIQINKAGDKKPNVWIEAGIHAREWIAGAMATYLINELVEGEEGEQFIDNLNIHILPIANPDGYEYSRSDDRLWRKTRSDNEGSGCKGVDGNRNWGYHFGESGVSPFKCSDTYPGEQAFSEVEMRNIRDYLQSLESVPILAHCLHSYGQLWLYPYGYAYDAYPPNVDEVRGLGEEAVAALAEVHGTVFDPINSAELYPAAGASDDYYMGVLGARFAYTTELRDTGRHGFMLPASEIKPSGEELWAAFKVVLKKMIDVSNE